MNRFIGRQPNERGQSIITRRVLLVGVVGAVAACTDSGPGTSGPELGQQAASIAASTAPAAGLSGGLSAASQPVNVQNDNATLLHLHTGGIATPYDGATAYTSVGPCVETNNPGGENLVQYLGYDYVPVGGGGFGMEFYKKTPTSSKHHVTVHWVDAQGIRTRVRLVGGINNRRLTVIENPPGGIAGGVTTYTYQGGTVKIERLSASKPPTLTCDNFTDVVVHFTRP